MLVMLSYFIKITKYVLTSAMLFWQSDRLHKVLDFVSTVHDLCAVLGMDFYSTVTEVHPSLDDSIGVQSKSISNDTLSNLATTVVALEEDKTMRLQKVTLVIFFSFNLLLLLRLTLHTFGALSSIFLCKNILHIVCGVNAIFWVD